MPVDVLVDMREQRFGLEVEFTGITRSRAARAVAEYFGVSSRHVGSSYDKWVVDECASGRMRTWTLMSDASVKGQQKTGGRIVDAGYEYRVEFVTPICTYADIEVVQELVRRMRKAGGFVNGSCGIHVHVDGARHTAESLKKLLCIWYSKQDLLYHALNVQSSRSGYCKKFTDEFIREINKKRHYRSDELRDAWYRLLGGSPTEHYSHSRYHGLNIHSYHYRGTVEFRCFNSTLHAGEIKSYIQLCLLISAQALNQRTAIARRTESTNPCFTFRTWLLRIGMIGDEFSTARLHLLKNLEGNRAWRYEEQDYPSRRSQTNEEE